MNKFTLTWEAVQSFPVIFLDGDITADAERLLEDVYKEIASQHNTKILMFDFSKVDYINSSGISAFIKVFRVHNETGGDFIFAGLSDHIKKVMDILELTDYVKVFKTIEMAIKHYKDTL